MLSYRSGAAGEHSFSRAACLYSGSLRHATRLLSGKPGEKSHPSIGILARGYHTVWGDIYSFSKWRGKFRCCFLLSKVYFSINSTCFGKCMLYITLRLCEMGMWSYIAVSCSGATGVCCWTCMHGCRSVLLITPAYRH